MIGQVLQIIGILAIGLGLAASILGAIWRMETIIRLEEQSKQTDTNIKLLSQSQINIEERLIKLEGKQS
jgi:hypothetical protein